MVPETNNPSAGYKENEHTADWELTVWAPDFPGLLEQAARGMYALAGVKLQDRARHTVYFIVEGGDAETMLVSFLEELRYLVEMEELAFDTFSIKEFDPDLMVKVDGAPLAEIEKEIKAVTYHNLHVQHGEQGLEASLVFDV